MAPAEQDRRAKALAELFAWILLRFAIASSTFVASTLEAIDDHLTAYFQ